MKQKTREEIEAIALMTLRRCRDRRLLTNPNVDCFVKGYEMAQETFFEKHPTTKDLLEETLSDLRSRADYMEDAMMMRGTDFTKEERAERSFIFDVISHISASMKLYKKRESLLKDESV